MCPDFCGQVQSSQSCLNLSHKPCNGDAKQQALSEAQTIYRKPQNPHLVPHRTPNVKQAIQPSSAVLLITLGVNLIFCPVIASFPLRKVKISQLAGLPVSVHVACQKTGVKVKTTKNIDIKQGLISISQALNRLCNCENTQVTKPLRAPQDTSKHKLTLYPQNVDKSKIQTGLT